MVIVQSKHSGEESKGLGWNSRSSSPRFLAIVLKSFVQYLYPVINGKLGSALQVLEASNVGGDDSRRGAGFERRNLVCQ